MSLFDGSTTRAVIAVGIGGMAGALLRFLLVGLCSRISMLFEFPVGTLFVNAIGCFAAGILVVLFERSTELPVVYRHFWMTGVLGGFTTFSAFSVETVLLLKRQPLSALLNIVLSVALGLSAAWLGMRLVAKE